MGDQNIFISNGTCYSAAGKKLDVSFIPCGNDAFGHQTCCGAGDNCLADNACFGIHGSGDGSYLTYAAGCSDPEYKDQRCPNKHIDQPWIALTLCDNSDGAWAVCSQEGNPSTLQPGSPCTCTDAASATVAFKDATVLSSSCSLPQSTGQSIQFFVGHIPTPGSDATNGGAAPTQTGSTSGSSRTPSPSEGSTGPSEGGTTTGLGSGAKVGIGVGVAVGLLLLLAIIAALFFLRRRRRRSTAKVDGDGVEPDPQRVSTVSTTPAVSEVDGKAARPWSMRSELEGSLVSRPAELPGEGIATGDAHAGRVRRSAELSPVAELPGSERWQAGGQGGRGPPYQG